MRGPTQNPAFADSMAVRHNGRAKKTQHTFHYFAIESVGIKTFVATRLKQARHGLFERHKFHFPTGKGGRGNRSSGDQLDVGMPGIVLQAFKQRVNRIGVKTPVPQ